MRRALATLLVAVLAGCGAESASEPEPCTADLSAVVEVGNEGIYQPTWSPDGTRVAFTTGSELLVVTLADCTLKRVQAEVDGLRVDWPDWSPDGESFAFAGNSALAAQGVYVMRADGSGVRLVAEADARSPAWSPDGRTIAYTDNGFDETTGTEDPNVRLVDAGGGEPRKVTEGYGSIDWSPDGEWLLTDTARGVVKIRPDGSGRTVLIPGLHPSPDWSPDGETIAVEGLAIAPADGGPLEQVETVENGGFEPAWSPDGEWIAFTAQAERNVWIVRPDGSGLRQLTRLGS